MIRLVAESGGIMNGGLAQVGSVGVTCAMRSCTSCRALSSSVPRSKISWIEESCETDFERSSSRPGHAAELLLDRDRDQLLDLGRGVAERDRLDLDPRRRELGEDVDLGARDLGDPEGHHRRGGEQHQPPEPQASGRRPSASRCPRRAVNGSGPRARFRTPRPRPTVTTLVPAGGPSLSSTRRPRCGRPRPAARRYVERLRARVDVGLALGGRRSAPRRARPCASPLRATAAVCEADPPGRPPR